MTWYLLWVGVPMLAMVVLIFWPDNDFDRDRGSH